MRRYGIEVIGSRYTIKELVPGGTNPTNGRVYETEEAARAAAADMGIEITAVGDIWQLMRQKGAHHERA